MIAKKLQMVLQTSTYFFWFFSLLYPNTHAQHTEMYINSYSCDMCWDIQTLIYRNCFPCEPLSCVFAFGDSRRRRVCLGPLLFINLFASTGWELSVEPKFKGKFFARFFSLRVRFCKELCLGATNRKSI